jgi:cytochrome P450
VRRLARSPRAPASVAPPFPFYAEARTASPLFFWEACGHACAAGWQAVNALLRDRRFGREPPDHTRPRGLVLRTFTSRRIAALAPGIAALATGLADRLEAPEADFLPAFARPFRSS